MTTEETSYLKQAFTSLVDAMRFVRQLEELDLKIRGAKRIVEKQVSVLDELNPSISGLVMDVKDSLGDVYATELTKQISGFSAIAIDQVKRRIAEKSKIDDSENAKAVDSERTKALRSIEAFLTVSLFPFIDKVQSLKLQDSAYEARSKYRCEPRIEYEFSLDTNNELFGKRFTFSNFVPEIRLPVKLAKNWLRKNPVPDFERLDQFFLLDAEATEKNLIANFSHEDGERKVQIVYSKQDTNSFLSVDYFSHGTSVNVTATPDLNVHLDSETLKKAMERLWLAINELEKHKIALKRLLCEDMDVLENLDCIEFFRKSWQTIAPRLSQSIKNVSSEGGAIRDENHLDVRLIEERLKLLGKEAREIYEILGLRNLQSP